MPTQHCNEHTQTDWSCIACHKLKLEYQRKYRKTHPEYKAKGVVYALQYYYNHPQQTKEWRKRNHEKHRILVLTHYSNGTMKCACCEESHLEFLTIDHINGNGAEEKRKLFGNRSGGEQFYLWLIRNNYPKGYQVLCYNCNCSKGHHGYCPHKGDR